MVIKKQVPHHFKILRELDLKPYKVTIGKKFMPKIHTELISQNKLFSKKKSISIDFTEKIIYSPIIEWIVQSMFQNQPVLEEEFAYCEEIIEEPEQTTEEQDTQFEDDLMAQYKGKYLGFL